MSDNDGATKKSWFARHKVLSIILGLILLIIIAGAAGGDDKTDNNQSNSGKSSGVNKAKQYRFADRSDKQSKDVEVLPGETATIDGLKMTLSNPEYVGSVSEYETADQGKTYVVADVSLENTSDKTQSYNVFDFRIQTAGGQVLDGTITSLPTISSGDLVSGGKAQGKIYFEVPTEEGHQYVIWKPGS